MIKVDSKAKLEHIFDEYNIKYKWILPKGITDFSRTVQFIIQEKKYTIVWFKNESNLYFGEPIRSNPCYNFRYIRYNDTHPGLNNGLQFGYDIEEDNFLGPSITWNSIIIPL